MVLDAGGEAGRALLVHKDGGGGEGVVAVLPVGQVRLCHQAVPLLQLQVLVAHLQRKRSFLKGTVEQDFRPVFSPFKQF